MASYFIIYADVDLLTCAITFREETVTCTLSSLVRGYLNGCVVTTAVEALDTSCCSYIAGVGHFALEFTTYDFHTCSVVSRTCELIAVCDDPPIVEGDAGCYTSGSCELPPVTPLFHASMNLLYTTPGSYFEGFTGFVPVACMTFSQLQALAGFPCPVPLVFVGDDDSALPNHTGVGSSTKRYEYFFSSNYDFSALGPSTAGVVAYYFFAEAYVNEQFDYDTTGTGTGTATYPGCLATVTFVYITAAGVRFTGSFGGTVAGIHWFYPNPIWIEYSAVSSIVMTVDTGLTVLTNDDAYPPDCRSCDDFGATTIIWPDNLNCVIAGLTPLDGSVVNGSYVLSYVDGFWTTTFVSGVTGYTWQIAFAVQDLSVMLTNMTSPNTTLGFINGSMGVGGLLTCVPVSTRITIAGIGTGSGTATITE